MRDLGEVIAGLRERMAVVLVEHHMDLVMRVCDRVLVLDIGKVIAHGTPDEVRDGRLVTEAYLGDEVGEGIAAAPSGSAAPASDGPGKESPRA